MTLVLDRLRWWHIEQITPIDGDLFGTERWTPAMFWNELANGYHYLGAFESAPDGEVVGYAGMALSPPDEAWVNTIGVRRDRQRSGIGRSLLEALLAYARQHDARRVFLEVAADNGPAQRLYDQYGFETIGVRRGYYQPRNADALVMRRDEPMTGGAMRTQA